MKRKKCKHEWMLVDKYLDDVAQPTAIEYVMICKWCLKHEIVELSSRKK